MIFTLFLVFITGLCIGSFLNVVIVRAFSNESIVLPPSKCPKCSNRLKWYHNIPVLSYLFLKGKCGFCKEKISIQYPVIELVTGLLFAAVVLKFQFSLNTIFMLAFVSLFVVLAATDIKEQVVFDFHTYILVGLGLVYNLFNIGHFYEGAQIFSLGGFSIAANNSIIASVLGIISGILIMEIFARLGYILAGTRAFGEGDTYIAAGLGAVFGWRYLLIILVYSFVIQIVLTIPVFFKKLYLKKDFKTIVSFIAFFLVAGAFRGLNSFKMLDNLIVFLILLALLTGVGIYACKRILSGIKDGADLTYLPFGPAMVTAAVVVLFLFL